MKKAKAKASPFETVYLKRLALDEKPFDASQDPGFFYPSRSYSAAMGALDSFLARGAGLALVYGDTGAGKTFICTRFLESIDRSRFDVAFVSDSSPDETAFLAEVAVRFHLTPLPSGEKAAQALAEGLATRSGKRAPVLVVDDAHRLSDGILHVLGELFAKSGESLRLVLFAGNELVGRLIDPRMDRFRRFIGTTHYLEALSPSESAAYIGYRLSRAGSNGVVRFTEEALNTIYLTSKGCPGLVDTICDRCLFLLSEQERTVVDQKVLNRVLGDDRTKSASEKAGRPGRNILYLAALVGAAIAVLSLLLFYHKPILGF